jgi:cullin 4
VQAVESMCVHKRAGILYTKLCAVTDEHTGAQVATMVHHVGMSDHDFLVHMDGCWRRHCEQMALIRAIFLYLDRSYVAAQTDGRARSIFDMGLRQFRAHLEVKKPVRKRMPTLRRMHNGRGVRTP